MGRLRGDLALAAVIAVGSVVSLQSENAPAAAIVAQVIAALSLALRRINPFVPTLIVLAATATTVLFTPTALGDVFYLAIWIVGVYTCGAHLPLGQSWVALALWWVTLFASVQGRLIWGDIAFMGILTLGAWLPGVLARRAEQGRRRAQELAERRRVDAAEAIGEERARIARELHDVVAHTIGVMVVHAGAAQEFLHRDPDRAREALDIVQTSGEQAVVELRRMLGVLRDDPENDAAPLPRLAQLDGLLDPARAAGHAVEVSLGAPVDDLPRAVDLTAYRVVQEAVTNAMKHAPGSDIGIALERSTDELRIRVASSGGRAAAGTGTGHGLLGLRERIQVFGGELEAGPLTGPSDGTDAAAFVLTARLPFVEPQQATA